MNKNWLDLWLEKRTRQAARMTSRRSVIRGIGSLLVGAGAYPLLPVWRNSAQADPASDADPGDPQNCDYWRYCAIDGFLCACCGGKVNTCPPGTIMSPVTWLGTCRNPSDGKDYIISYNDCCGNSPCGRCMCNRNEGDTPAYLPATSNNINWCTGSSADIAYNCSTAIILGIDE
jgi:methylamine dehydrogenase light chain